ncbi:glycosyltransferase family 2 protein, partial [Massilia agilis]
MQAQLASRGSPAVSIVVPAYNAQDLVAACLQSIVPQMTAAHELVLVDDGSRDRTAERAQAVFDERPGLRARL